MHNLINDQNDHYNVYYTSSLEMCRTAMGQLNHEDILVLICFTSKKPLGEEESGDPERFRLTTRDPRLATEKLTERVSERDAIKCVYF